jgi:hypothetical protein
VATVATLRTRTPGKPSPERAFFFAGRQDYQGIGVNPLIRSPFSGIKEITELTGERKISEA